MAGAGRPAGGGGRTGEALGRSRGGLSTKIHLIADGRCRILAFLITPGQWGDSPQFMNVLDAVRVLRIGPGRPRVTPASLTADKAYSSRTNRAYLRRRGIRHTIAEPRDQQQHRRNRGAKGGRPPRFDTEHYKTRNTVERAIGRLKQFRAVATRYDKRAYLFTGTITIAVLLIWLRT